MNLTAADLKHAEGRMAWFWLSFADPRAPVGEQWLGVTIERASSASAAVVIAGLAGRNPGGEVQIHGPIDDATIEMHAPPGARERLITDRAELETLVGKTTSASEEANRGV